MIWYDTTRHNTILYNLLGGYSLVTAPPVATLAAAPDMALASRKIHHYMCIYYVYIYIIVYLYIYI